MNNTKAEVNAFLYENKCITPTYNANKKFE